MVQSQVTGDGQQTVDVFTRYAGPLDEALAISSQEGSPVAGFSPAWSLPRDVDGFQEFVSVARARISPLLSTKYKNLKLLNMMLHENTRTTKTFASLIIVGRAVAHFHDTGEPVLIITPSSANKATALRDAVLRAYETGLANPRTLRIVSVVPEGARPKLWSSALSTNQQLASANPLVVTRVAEPGDVKARVRRVSDRLADQVFAQTGFRLWQTMDVRNYMVADSLRSYVEHESLPDSKRLHVHAVSSAFGLLGHAFGERLRLDESGARPTAEYLLVQHLGTSDMVSSLYFNRFDFVPTWSVQDGLYTQQDPRYPAATYDPDERLDVTFYTHSPATSAEMNSLIRTNGGGGIVVSLWECLQRYAEVRSILASASVSLPGDPRDLREWSLVMACTGLLNALDRGVVQSEDILVHASGSYSTADYAVATASELFTAVDDQSLAQVIQNAASVKV